MQSFYFTFGPYHYTKKGIPMRDRWVRVDAASAEEAREIFQAQFAAPVMQKPDRWSAQYPETEFAECRGQYKAGEYLKIAADQ